MEFWVDLIIKIVITIMMFYLGYQSRKMKKERDKALSLLQEMVKDCNQLYDQNLKVRRQTQSRER